MTRRALLVLAATVCLTACRDAPASTNVSAAAALPQRASGRPDRVHLDDPQMEQVRIEELSTSTAASSVALTGTIEFNADRTSKLLPPVPGQIQDLAVNVGDTVHRNDVLFTLSSREAAAAAADRLASRKDLELAEKTFSMTKDLFEHGAASRIALAQSESELAKARSRATQAEETLRVLGLDADGDVDPTVVQTRVPVRTPIDGTIIERNVTNGQFVGTDVTAPLVTIADLSSVWVQGDVFERDLRYVSIGQKADVTTPAYPADRFNASVSRVAPVVDPQTRTAKVRFLVANPGARLKPGMFASISVFLPAPESALTVPSKAVFVEDGRTFAYVQTGPREFARRALEAVPGGGDRLRVVQGVHAGDRVVCDGVLLLRQLETDSPDQ